eukprot:s1513_g20.t1
MKTLDKPHIWYDTEFPHEEEAAGVTKEMKSMRDFDVFDEVSVDNVSPEALNSAISTKWVKVRKPDGTVRCRIVGRGYTQQVEDKDETFASTPSLTTLRLLLTLAVAKGWHISIGDISTAFLHALGRTLWKLKKALYGLKHSPKLWQQHFASVMDKNCFRRMKSDPNLYVHDSKQLYVLAYVDDLMFFGSQAGVSTLIKDLQKDLLLKVTGTLDEGTLDEGMSPSYIDAMLELCALKQYRDYFMAIPANGQVTLTFQTADERAMLQAAIVLLHPAYDDGYFICNGLNTLLDRAESPWWRLSTYHCREDFTSRVRFHKLGYKRVAASGGFLRSLWCQCPSSPAAGWRRSSEGQRAFALHSHRHCRGVGSLPFGTAIGGSGCLGHFRGRQALSPHSTRLRISFGS